MTELNLKGFLKEKIYTDAMQIMLHLSFRREKTVLAL